MSNSDHIINLIWLSQESSKPSWAFGSTFVCPPNPAAVHHILEAQLEGSPADAWLFWDGELGEPPTPKIQSFLYGPADVWHAGLKLGLAGRPDWIDFITPTWMLNRDPDPTFEATSWRLSLRACLIRSDILRQLGGHKPHFETLAGAGLELGHRYIRQGAFLRHVPDMLEGALPQPEIKIPFTDQCRFIRSCFTPRWLAWAGLRAVLTGGVKPLQLWRAWRSIRDEKPFSAREPYQRPPTERAKADYSGRVSVLIPTLRRYPYLRTLLEQLQTQTVAPCEILIIDQTPEEERDSHLVEAYSNLPIRYFTLDQAGQCSSRNLGLQHAKGEFILFIDDDDEIPPDLIQKHLAALHHLNTNISNGVAHEVAAGELPKDFRFMRISSVFPTNNTMIRKNVLKKSGLFDLAYDRGQRADHDLGMRLYLSGELMVLNPEISVLHHHAPQGGLREHKARVDTYAASRQGLFKRNLPTVSDIYLAKRYYSNQQVKEMFWISILGTFSLEGSLWKCLLKIIISLLGLPNNLWIIRKRSKLAQDLLEDYPQIPNLNGVDRI